MCRFAIILLLYVQAIVAQKVTLGPSFEDASVRRDLQTVADNVSEIVGSIFDHLTPPVPLPIHVELRHSPLAETIVRAQSITIYVSVANRGYAQFAFQLGHELAHVMLHPKRSNGIVETLCAAVSFAVLDSMSTKWSVAPPYPNWRRYAPEFRLYREHTQRTMLMRFPEGVRGAVTLQDWAKVREHMRAHAKDQMELSREGLGGKRGRDVQQLGAMLLLSKRIDWYRLLGIAACTDPSPSADPSYLNLPLQRHCLDDLRDIFSVFAPGLFDP